MSGLEHFIRHLKAHKFVQQAADFVFHYSLETSLTNMSKIVLQLCYSMHLLGYTKLENSSLHLSNAF